MRPIDHYRLADLRGRERRLENSLNHVRSRIDNIRISEYPPSHSWLKRFINWWRAS